MSITVEPLNADTTFLLTFNPPFAPFNPSPNCPPDNTHLLDPWLSGSSSILHPAFQISHHGSKPFITYLSDLRNPPNLIVISQDKADHCHKATLCSIPASWAETNILAVPAAARKILSWEHFDPERVHVLPVFDPAEGDSVVRIPLPGCSDSAVEGEITIANVASKRDLTGLHNAIGITYQPASTVLTAVALQRGSQDQDDDCNNAGKSLRHSASQRSLFANSVGRLRGRASISSLRKALKRQQELDPPPPVPPLPPQSSCSTHSSSRVDSALTTPTSELEPKQPTISYPHNKPQTPKLLTREHNKPDRNTEKVLSALYTPHGLSPSLLKPYLTTHLSPLPGALPATLLFHCLNTESNPWFLGGTVCNGAPRGVVLAEMLGGVRNWVAAHDEEKVNLGLATRLLRSRRFEVREVEALMGSFGVSGTRVWGLGRGDRLRVWGDGGMVFEEGVERGVDDDYDGYDDGDDVVKEEVVEVLRARVRDLAVR